MRVLVCLACVVVCSTQESTTCDSPKRWIGKRTRMNEGGTFIQQQIVYDEDNQRIKTVDTPDPGTQQDAYLTLYLHTVSRLYRFNLRTKQCNVIELVQPFRPIGVPPMANFLEESVFALTKLFNGTYSDGARYVVEVTSADCIPVNVVVYNNTEYIAGSYYDVVLGITDMSVFIPPEECIKNE